MLAQQLVNGLMLGSTYAIIGVGYSLIFGVLRLLNLAQSYFFAAAPFLCIWLAMALGVPPLLAIPLSLLGTTMLGFLLYFISFKPVPQSFPLGGFVSSLAFGIIIQVIIVNRFGTIPITFPISIPLPDYTVGAVLISGVQTFTLLFTAIVLIALLTTVKSTKFGRDMRALAENARAAALLGVRVERTILAVFAISTALAALAGLLMAIRFGAITPYMSERITLKALAVIVIGGLGDLRGAMVAGVALGVLEVLAQAYMPSGSSEALIWCALILVFVIKPEGLFGTSAKRREV